MTDYRSKYQELLVQHSKALIEHVKQLRAQEESFDLALKRLQAQRDSYEALAEERLKALIELAEENTKLRNLLGGCP